MADNRLSRLFQAAQIAALVCFAALFAGCASKAAPNRVVRLAVLDGRTAYAVAPGGETLDKGWWFSARDTYLSPNVNSLLADMLAIEFAEVPGVEVYSREDLTVYMAQKERQVKRNFPELTALERKKLLEQQSPLDYGLSLNVDYVLMPEVIESKTVTNRTFSWWYSRLEAAVELWDVPNGVMVQRYLWSDWDNLDSQQAMAKEAAREIARKARKQDVFELYD